MRYAPSGVLSFPYELSGLAATRLEALAYLSRFFEAVRARYRRLANWTARDGDALSCAPAPSPTRAELAEMLVRVHARVMKCLARRDPLRDPDASNDVPYLSPAEAVASMGMQRDTLATVREESRHSAQHGRTPSISVPRRSAGGRYDPWSRPGLKRHSGQS